MLSAGYEVLGQIDWRRAMTLWVSGRVEVLEEHEHRVVRTVRVVFQMPSVVRFLRGHRRHAPVIKFSKENVFVREKGRCAYCQRRLSRPEATFDHVLPRSRGGTARWENIVLACMPCNQRKGDRTPEEARMLPHVPPRRPRSLPGMFRGTQRFQRGMPDEWLPYMPSTSEDRSG